MRQFLIGAVAALALTGSGVWLWQVVANDPEPLPEAAPPPAPGETPLRGEPVVLPEVDPGSRTGPPLPDPTIYQPSREERRFNRYDRDRDNLITRVEMLSTRTNAFKKLDKDGNNLLTFEEWAVTTSDRFAEMDANNNRILTRTEFATSRPKPAKKKPACRC